MRVACDTNVLVSAFIAAGPPSRVLEEAIDSRIELVLLAPVMAELERILIQKLGFEPERWQGVEELLLDLAVELAPAPDAQPEAVTGDPDDDLILACAIDAGVEILVSGDRRHLLPLGPHRGVQVITPQALLAELRAV
ncbi:MAG TPA: putative toxin-antitoxin system toxin component, PIN family [Solirubrobacterales bacterium]|nr:putative toxin-antitoxin system toxin component, PIN family [Solirubrobacterales bacterium]